MKHTILDPSDSSWNDNYQKFRLGVNETENLVENVLNEAFETVTSVKEGVEILDVFHQYTPRFHSVSPSHLLLSIPQAENPSSLRREDRACLPQVQCPAPPGPPVLLPHPDSQVRRDLSLHRPVGLDDQPQFAAKNIWLNNLQTKITSTVDTLKSASWSVSWL